MNTAELLQEAETLMQPWASEKLQPEANRLDFVVPVSQLLEAAETLLSTGHGYLAAITGLDIPPREDAEGQIEAIYSFCEGAAVVSLRVRVPYSCPVLPTLCDLVPSATLYERELIEMLGVEVEGTPDTSRLILPDDWPDGVYPLRKSFTGFSPKPEALERA